MQSGSSLVRLGFAWSLVVALAPCARAATSGDLDATFGTGGKVTADLGFGSRGFSVALQPDGKIIVGGTAASNFALARYNPDGSLDPGFDGDGFVTTALGGSAQVFAVSLQADGKIVAAGAAAPGGYCCAFALARYNPDGSLDATFDADGIVTTSFGGDTEARALAIQPDGRIVAVGYTYSPFGGFFALARYNSDGSLDATFDGDGEVTTDFGGVFSQASDVALQADGRIVVAGAGGPTNDVALARYNADGSLDTTFDGDGRLTTDLGGYDRAEGLAIQTDGKIVVAGQGGVFTVFALLRYRSDGSLDPGFDGDGKVSTTFYGESIEGATALALQVDGRIVAAGSASFNSARLFALARYNPDGSLDADFGTGGKVTTSFGDRGNDGAEDVAIQADGKIVAVGGSGPCTPPCQFALARYLGKTVTQDVSIDIMPGSRMNPISLSSRGVVPVALLSTSTFDATLVDPQSVCFGDDDHPSERDCTEAHGRGHVEDVNCDHRPDLVLHYTIRLTGIDRRDTRACLTGQTFAGDSVQGCDRITTK